MWDQLTDAARTALEDTDFGDANVPFKEANFATKVANAYYAKIDTTSSDKRRPNQYFFKIKDLF
ncbi:hypothetical protein PR002_g23486 [Phytophthora rubi]|nr:hypothetical protein PR002_g23486 [Phytophthora rubi]